MDFSGSFFLYSAFSSASHGELNKLVDDFLETSGIAFGIRDARSPNLHLIGKQAKIMQYMAKHTGGEYFSVPSSEYETTLQTILMLLHFRNELGFIPPAVDAKHHQLRVELKKSAKARHKGLRLRYRPEYIPVREPRSGRNDSFKTAPVQTADRECNGDYRLGTLGSDH